ncbi:ferritin [Pelagicoccus albus]|uniref:Ferritin n=1 Tax=Pelagicoccus albus TaxID=415222 RepID=A0A7X1B5T8_9BACT|nr:ferritin [Pelagicoccus albus]MBC2606188.1 ferritin [Pelagicoccus albus]
MKPEISKALNDQANHELLAAHAYEAMSLWCAWKDYPGFASFFSDQAGEEREHAGKFLTHLLERGEKPGLTGIETPKPDFTSLSEIAEYALKLEKTNSEKIEACYELALELKDYASQPMLLELITEQIEEEAWGNQMVTLTKRAECPGAAFSLDRHIKKILSPAE